MREEVADCSRCGLCDAYADLSLDQVCPRLGSRRERLQKGLGEYRERILTRGCLPGTYSGSVISVLVAAREAGMIDGVLGVSRGDSIVEPKPTYATTPEQIAQMSGMRHTVSSHLSKLREVPRDDEIALVGLPCHIEAIHHLREQGLLAHSIRFLICLACGTNYDRNAFLEVIKESGIDLDEVDSYTLRNTHSLSPYFSFTTASGEEHRLPVSKTVGCIPRGCARCSDYLGYASDLSFSVLGAPRGYSMAFIRNHKGKKLIENAHDQGMLQTKGLSPGGLSGRILARTYRLLPARLYLPLAFKTDNPVGAELMAQFKQEYLPKWLGSPRNG